jgi:hypothetical protein
MGSQELCAQWAVKKPLDVRVPIGHILTPQMRKKATEKQLRAQAAELLALRGERPHKEWTELLGVSGRAYYRYEGGQRLAPEPMMRLARTIKPAKPAKK